MSIRRVVKISISLLVIVAISYLCYGLIAGWYKGRVETAENQAQKVWQEKNEVLMDQIAGLEEEIKRLKGQNIPVDKLSEVFGEEGASALPIKDSNLTFEEIESQIAAFFVYLDEKAYVEDNGLSGSTYSQYELSVGKLSDHLPLVTGETATLYNLFLNVAHFYRVLGKDRLFLIRDILNNESDIIESVMKPFYLWYTSESNIEKNVKGRPSLRMLYDYAGFFLTTLGGKGYLLRRDSRLRILTTYYCVLILDIANDKKLNSNGIDIRPHIRSTFNDISNYIGLINQGEYMTELENLMLKYNIS
ncbi:hypothetical protein OAC89_05325 [Deltaproteobacteria bacterium]|nr:hypothetical protein [Deltaproteobacteria bacterium]